MQPCMQEGMQGWGRGADGRVAKPIQEGILLVLLVAPCSGELMCGGAWGLYPGGVLAVGGGL